MTSRKPRPWLILLAIITIAFVLRGPVIAVAPIVGTIAKDLGITAAQAGLLTSIPVLCFAVITPAASVLIGRAGANAAATMMIFGVALGNIVRSSGDSGAVFTGTVIMGIFITVGNVVVPVIIRRDFPTHRAGVVTGVYTSALNTASMVTSIATAPIATALGWRAALGTWTALSVIAAIVWFVAVGPRAASRWGLLRPAVETSAIDTVPVTAVIATSSRTISAGATWTSATALLLALTFAGQSFAYYGLTAWFPRLLADERGLSVEAAGSSSSVFQIAAVIGALGIPVLAQRVGVVPAIAVLGALWATIPLGLIFASAAWPVWAVLGGAAQGGGITLVFMLVVKLATSDHHARQLSAMVQVIGYAVAATAPAIVGATFEISMEWTWPLLVVGAGVALFAASGLGVALRAFPRQRA